ncbi:MAG: serine O-acetyltransferase [Alphaproteobacteria bacterium]|nr:serine O-acetyltransferase [Alphaproteobacteria bacterium]
MAGGAGIALAFETVRSDIAAIFERDPAVRSLAEVWLGYPGFHAVLMHRLTHRLWLARWRLLARTLSNFARFLTGVEIHPGATIGKGFFIDHGNGVVIGETAQIGDNVTLYHDVTLGGIAPAVDSASQVNMTRHPTLRNGVIIGSGAQVLGPIVVGENARVGANSVVLKDVPPGATVVGVPGRVAMTRRDAQFEAYGTSRDKVSDPVARVIEGLLDQIESLQARVSKIEGDKPQPWKARAEENQD